jgi:hypothetical protein
VLLCHCTSSLVENCPVGLVLGRLGDLGSGALFSQGSESVLYSAAWDIRGEAGGRISPGSGTRLVFGCVRHLAVSCFGFVLGWMPVRLGEDEAMLPGISKSHGASVGVTYNVCH